MDAPAGWYPDPLRRYEHRYWDGSRWTDHAASGGRTVSDPLEAPTPPRTDVDTAAPSGSTVVHWPEASSAGTSGSTEGLAIVSLILSIVWIVGLGSIAGIITGVMARRRIRDSGGTRTGNGIAVAGIVIGILGLGLTILVGLFIAFFVAADVNSFQTATGLA